MKKIAVIEDNFDNRLILSAMIGHLYTLQEYTTGPEALSALPQAIPDLILLDISLPGMDGTEVLQKLRAQPESANIPVIALTAHAMSGDRERFLAQGFNGYLAKPILDTQPLIDLIEGLLAT